MPAHPTVSDLHVRDTTALVSPDSVRSELPSPATAAALVAQTRDAVAAIIAGRDPRLLAIVGPCSIHDPEAALDYARRLKPIADRVADRVLVLMRVYFEKPRTTIGWKGLINDPHLDGSHDIATGLRTARHLLLELANLGLPAACEMLDPISPQYLADLVSWAAIGARTAESQTHREMASGLSMPVGFKNGIDGSLSTAANAILAAARPHSFLGINGEGRIAVVRTTGNQHCHAVLRGGAAGPNHDAASVARAQAALAAAGVPSRVMIDCSHGNSGKDHRRQPLVLEDCCAQLAAGSKSILGVMIESHLVAGAQAFPPAPGTSLTYGQSITDACVDLPTTEALLLRLAQVPVATEGLIAV